MVNPLEQGKCIRFEKIRVVIGDNVSVKNVDFYKTEHDFINDDPFNMPLSQEEKTYPIMTNGNRRTFFQPEPRCPAPQRDPCCEDTQQPNDSAGAVKKHMMSEQRVQVTHDTV